IGSYLLHSGRFDDEIRAAAFPDRHRPGCGRASTPVPNLAPASSEPRMRPRISSLRDGEKMSLQENPYLRHVRLAAPWGNGVPHSASPPFADTEEDGGSTPP